MFDAGSDQAQGLVAWELRPPTRVIPVVAGDDELSRRRSLQLLWSLEQGYVQQGHTVEVVEGLNGLLPRDALLGHRVVLKRWLEGTAPGGVVLLHAPLAALASLLADSVARPLVPLGDDRAAVVQAYQAVKVLWQAAALMPVVIPVESCAAALQEQAAQALVQACERCLGMVPSLWWLGYDQPPAGKRNVLQNDASLLKVLDSALMIEDSGSRQYADQRFARHPSQADQNIGVSDVHRQRHAGP
jgi:hypothetical protein